MMRVLGPLHAIAAQRGDGLLPEFARLWERPEAEAAAIEDTETAVLYGQHRMAQPRAKPEVAREIASDGNVVRFRTPEASRSRKAVKTVRT
jgi:hypothetical protein